MADRPWYEDAPVPQLMREARDVYRHAVVVALAGVGCDDVPRNGAFVLADLDLGGSDPKFHSQPEAVTSHVLSKQAASQLIDSLVLREYLERRNDPVDRRRMEVRLTERGRMAASAIRTAIDEVEAGLAQLISADELHGLRAGLAAYRAIRAQA